MTVAAIVAAAGRGERLGAGVAKALVTVGGRTLLEHSVDALVTGGADVVVIAAPPEASDDVRRLVPSAVVVDGGEVRQLSVQRALAALPAEVDVVLVHDAARALVPPVVVRRVLAALDAGARAVVPVVPVADTVKEVDAQDAVVRTVDRSMLRAVQTPQGFARDLLERAHSVPSLGATDDAALVERLGETVHTVPGDAEAFKVTTPLDLTVAAAVLARRSSDVRRSDVRA